MTSPLPSNMALTTVRGRYGTWSTLAGQPEPQFTPFVGMRVNFSPAYPFVTNNTALPSPVVVATAPRIFQTDSEGYLSDPAAGYTGLGIGNNRNCQIVSSDDPDIYPRDWKYLVTFTGPGATNFRSFRTPAPAGSIIDMAIITPQRVTAGSTPNAAEVAAANAAASAAAAQDAVASINKGQAGGVAPLDADGDVNNAFGVKVLPGGGGGGSSTLAGITDMSGTAKLFNAALTGGHATTKAEMRAAIGAGTGDGTGTSNLIIGTTSGTAADAAVMATALAAKAADSAVLHKAGDETKDGVLTLTSPLRIPAGTAAENAVTLAQLTAATGAASPTNYSAIASLPGYPATFPPTLPIASSGVTGFSALDSRVATLEARVPTIITGLSMRMQYATSDSNAVRPTIPTGWGIDWKVPVGVVPVNLIAGDGVIVVNTQ